MRSRVHVAQHPLHPMLVALPAGLFPLLVVLDLLAWSSGRDAFWTVGFWLAALGVVSTLAAMVPGLVDFLGLEEGSRAHRIGTYHAATGTLVLLLYAVAAVLRWPPGEVGNFAPAVAIDVLGLLAVALQGWMGGHLVYHHHVGVQTVDEGADPALLQRGGAKGARARPARRGGPSRP